MARWLSRKLNATYIEMSIISEKKLNLLFQKIAESIYNY